MKHKTLYLTNIEFMNKMIFTSAKALAGRYNTLNSPSDNNGTLKKIKKLSTDLH